MIDLLIEDLYPKCGMDPSVLTQRRVDEINKLKSQQEGAFELFRVFEDDEEVKRLANCKTVKDACQEFDLQTEAFDDALKFAKSSFECGNYEQCLTVLLKFGKLLEDTE